MRRVTATLLMVGTMLLLMAGPAAADPARPTPYRSTVTAIKPPEADLEVSVEGGDAFLLLTAPKGVEVVVEGYEGEPYLRIGEDGIVEVNERSPARYLNDSRYGSRDVTVPASADPEAAPLWTVVGSGGTYAWHDHRIHWMSPALPQQVDATSHAPQLVQEWEVPIQVDGADVAIHGRLEWLPPRSPVLPVLVLVLVALSVALATRRGTLSVAGAVGAVALAAVALGASTAVTAPPGAPTDPTTLIAPLAAVSLAVMAVAWRRDPRARWLAVGAAVVLGAWAVRLLGALTAPIAPGPLPAAVSAAVVGASFGAAIGAIVGALTLALARPDVDELLAAGR